MYFDRGCKNGYKKSEAADRERFCVIECWGMAAVMPYNFVVHGVWV
ncbi:MAG: hypothetical protein J1E83_05755 [Lachnospiraceae bacterium]|nr:hypothetical protein [Lachnospiraceae bacterium]